MKQPLALVIDDEPDICELLTLTLGRMDVQTKSAVDVAGAKALLAKHEFDICLTDMRLPDGDGLDLVKWIQTNVPGLPVAVITAHGNVETAVQALKLGAFDFISKPLDLQNLRNIVKSALKVSRKQPDGDSPLLGESEPMNQLKEMVARVARSQAPVHISGDSGTGKELVARAIHDLSKRADRPLITVNCAAIPETLLESELFGHVRGAFTGADHDRVGKFEFAHGGTMFLDEVGDMPMATQIKLLRVLENGTYYPLGGTAEARTTARVVAATNRDLAEEVSAGRFREDLFYRLNVVSLKTLPLRQRPEDIEVLARHILHTLAIEGGLPLKQLAASATHLLLAHDWPGNVRELRNVVERAMILSRGETLCLDSSLDSRRSIDVPAVSASETGLAAIERRHIVSVLKQCGGKIKGPGNAAEQLGLKPSTLRSRMKKLGVLRPRALNEAVG